VNLLDENIVADEREKLLSSRIPFKQIGVEACEKGIKDEQILPFLLTLNNPTFFTQDQRFYRRHHCHDGYCIVLLDVKRYKVAGHIARFLRHSLFRTKKQRRGLVIHVSIEGISFWTKRSEKEIHAFWSDA
jgi:hypothetical protein